MTLKEADEAAWKRLPVVCQGIEYQRITQTGYHYTEKDGRVGFVQLLSCNGNSVTYADPKHCHLKE